MAEDVYSVFEIVAMNPGQFGRAVNFAQDPDATKAALELVGWNSNNATILAIEVIDATRTIKVHVGGPDAQTEVDKIIAYLEPFIGKPGSKFNLNYTSPLRKVTTGRDRRSGRQS